MNNNTLRNKLRCEYCGNTSTNLITIEKMTNKIEIIIIMNKGMPVVPWYKWKQQRQQQNTITVEGTTRKLKEKTILVKSKIGSCNRRNIFLYVFEECGWRRHSTTIASTARWHGNTSSMTRANTADKQWGHGTFPLLLQQLYTSDMVVIRGWHHCNGDTKLMHGWQEWYGSEILVTWL